MTTTDGVVHLIRPIPVSSVRSAGTLSGSGAMLAGPQGAVWLAASVSFSGPFVGDGLWRLDAPAHQVQPEDIKDATAIHIFADGQLIVGSGGWLWSGRGDRLVRDVPLPVHGESKTGQALWLAEEDSVAHSMWVSVLGEGLYLRRGESWDRNGGLKGLPTNEPTAMEKASDGALWLGYSDGRVFQVRGGAVQTLAGLDRSNDIGVGSIRVISSGRLTLIGGDRGLALLQDGRARRLTTDQQALEGITGIAQTSDGDVWLNAFAGLIKIPASQLSRVVAERSAEVRVRLFDASDGYVGDGAGRHPFGNTLVQASDGRIWFAGTSSPARLDPADVSAEAPPSPLVISSVSYGANRVEPRGPLHLPSGTRDIQLDYTALNYAHPDRERFRYRLAGLYESWTQAGNRRQAFFTNLGPGHYRFEVQSRNGTNDWTALPVALDIDIPPTFLQGRLFATLCVLAGIAVLVFFVRLREQYVRQRERARLAVRMAERERIARELHDTLLQSTQGLALKVQAGLMRLRAGQSSSQLLQEALEDADRLMVEGRDRIQDLRADVSDPHSMEEQLHAFGSKLATDHTGEFRLGVEGTACELQAVFADEAHRIATEALLNAFRHAQPRHVEVQLVFRSDEFRLHVRDDGRGIAEEVLRDGRADGRWGLQGMRERAARLGCVLEIWSFSGAGTEIELRAPAQVAYVDEPAPWWALHRGARRWRRGGRTEREASDTAGGKESRREG